MGNGGASPARAVVVRALARGLGFRELQQVGRVTPRAPSAHEGLRRAGDGPLHPSSAFRLLGGSSFACFCGLAIKPRGHIDAEDNFTFHRTLKFP